MTQASYTAAPAMQHHSSPTVFLRRLAKSAVTTSCRPWTPASATPVYLWGAVATLLLAALLRFAQLATVPHGMYIDEAYNVLDATAISWQNHPIFFPQNTGREPLFFYWEDLFLLGIGVSTFSARLASTFLSVITIALQIAVMRQLFNWRVGLLSGAMLATMYCYVQDSRIALRFNAVPLFTLLVVFALWRTARKPTVISFAFSGLLIGAAFYTYTSARVMPLIGVAFLLYTLISRNAGVGGGTADESISPEQSWQEQLMSLFPLHYGSICSHIGIHLTT